MVSLYSTHTHTHTHRSRPLGRSRKRWKEPPVGPYRSRSRSVSLVRPYFGFCINFIQRVAGKIINPKIFPLKIHQRESKIFSKMRTRRIGHHSWNLNLAPVFREEEEPLSVLWQLVTKRNHLALGKIPKKHL